MLAKMKYKVYVRDTWKKDKFIVDAKFRMKFAAETYIKAMQKAEPNCDFILGRENG